MAVQKSTPEEKLFAVIQGAAKISPLRARAQALSLNRLGATLAALLGPINLPRVNRFLFIVMILLGLWCALTPFLMAPGVERLMREATQQIHPFAIRPPLEGLKPTEQYVQLIQERDPFRLEAARQAPISSAAQPPAPQGPAPSDLVKDFKLVGISWSPEPVAMIEQVSSKQSSFLKAGDRLGSATVKEILQDRVILRIGEENVELF